MNSYNQLKAYLEDVDIVLTMWSEFAKIKTIKERTGMSEDKIREIIRKALFAGEIEERRVYHGKK